MTGRIKPTVRRARRDYCCMTGNAACTGVQAGERHWVHTLPPHDNDIGNEGWWRGRECAACASLYGRPLPEAVSA